MKTATIGLRISEQEKEQLEAIAAKRDVSLSQIIREIIKEYLKEN